LLTYFELCLSLIKGAICIDLFRRKSSEMARHWRGLCPAVDCNRMMMMMVDVLVPYHIQHGIKMYTLLLLVTV
jgi:hypothetical protein